jgi:hypothetical protein
MMKPFQIAGAMVLVVGVVLLGFAWHASQAPLDQLSNALTGRFTNETMGYCIVGVAAVVGGGWLALAGRRG